MPGGFLVAEGRLVIERILAGAAGGPDAIVAVIAAPAAARALRLEEHVADRLTIRAPSEMEALTGFNFHRGVLALVRRPPVADVRHVIAAAMAGSEGTRYPLPVTRDPVMAVLEHLVDVDNVGSCFRNARAFGAACVLLDDRCPDPLYRKAVRTSLGHVLEVPWARAPTVEILDGLRERGIQAIGLTPLPGNGRQASGRLRDVLDGLDPRLPVALIVGNEGRGLTAVTLAACTHLGRIPMAAGADSLNVATALAIALYEVPPLATSVARTRCRGPRGAGVGPGVSGRSPSTSSIT